MHVFLGLWFCKDYSCSNWPSLSLVNCNLFLIILPPESTIFILNFNFEQATTNYPPSLPYTHFVVAIVYQHLFILCSCRDIEQQSGYLSFNWWPWMKVELKLHTPLCFNAIHHLASVDCQGNVCLNSHRLLWCGGSRFLLPCDVMSLALPLITKSTVSDEALLWLFTSQVTLSFQHRDVRRPTVQYWSLVGLGPTPYD